MISLFIEYDERHKSNWLTFIDELSEFSSEIIDLWPRDTLNIFFLLSKDLEMCLCMCACVHACVPPTIRVLISTNTFRTNMSPHGHDAIDSKSIFI